MGIRIQLTSFLNATLGIILLIIGVIGRHWSGRESKRIHIYEGLWTRCVNHKHDEEREIWCFPLNDGAFNHKNRKRFFTRRCRQKSDQFVSIMVFLFLAMFLHLISFFVAIYLFCKDKKNLEKGLAVLQFFILIFTVIGLAIYATLYDSNYYALKWSYALCWGSTLCMFAALVFTIINIDRKRHTIIDNNQRSI